MQKVAMLFSGSTYIKCRSAAGGWGGMTTGDAVPLYQLICRWICPEMVLCFCLGV